MDPLLKRAMDKLFKDRGDGRWHMYNSDETRFYPKDESRTMRSFQKEKTKLGFVDQMPNFLNKDVFSVLLFAGRLNLRHLSRASRKSKRFERLFLIATFASLCDGDEWKALT